MDRIWIRQKPMVCLLCGYKAKGQDLKSGEVLLCPNDGCKGVYCSKCFTDINNKCTLCRNPIDYGDITDISEEKYILTRVGLVVLIANNDNNSIMFSNGLITETSFRDSTDVMEEDAVNRLPERKRLRELQTKKSRTRKRKYSWVLVRGSGDEGDDES